MKNLRELDQEIEQTSHEIDRYKLTLEALADRLRFLREIRQRRENYTFPED